MFVGVISMQTDACVLWNASLTPLFRGTFTIAILAQWIWIYLFATERQFVSYQWEHSTQLSFVALPAGVCWSAAPERFKLAVKIKPAVYLCVLCSDIQYNGFSCYWTTSPPFLLLFPSGAEMMMNLLLKMWWWWWLPSVSILSISLLVEEKLCYLSL